MSLNVLVLQLHHVSAVSSDVCDELTHSKADDVNRREAIQHRSLAGRLIFWG
jgi:hypothetical protein